jgi:hypothetical protein
MRYVAEVTAANDGQVEARTITSALINSSSTRIPMSALATKWSRALPKLRECLSTKGAVRADSIHVRYASGIGHRQPRRPPAPTRMRVSTRPSRETCSSPTPLLHLAPGSHLGKRTDVEAPLGAPHSASRGSWRHTAGSGTTLPQIVRNRSPHLALDTNVRPGKLYCTAPRYLAAGRSSFGA